MKSLLRKLAIGGVVISLLGGAVSSFPSVQRAYYKNRAQAIIGITESEIGRLDQTITRAEKSIDETRYIMTGEEEISPLVYEIGDSEKKLEVCRERFATALGEFNSGNFTEVRQKLDRRKASNSGIELEETPQEVAKREIEDLEGKVIRYCKDKNDVRAVVLDNERLLQATLHKPLEFSLEVEAELQFLPEEYRAIIPMRDDSIAGFLMGLGTNLDNRMGVNLAKSYPLLDHIEKFGANEEVKEHARGLFNSARESYDSVEPQNDKLSTWYKPKEHDGTFKTGDYQDLLRAQSPAVEAIRRGNNLLNELHRYFEDLHEQHYTFVSKHYYEDSTESEPDVDIDFDGDISFDMESVDKRTFYYELKTVTPDFEKTEKIRVGKKDRDNNRVSWKYEADQQVGYVREWKKFHHDSNQIFSGQGLNLRMGRPSPECSSIKTQTF